MQPGGVTQVQPAPTPTSYALAEAVLPDGRVVGAIKYWLVTGEVIIFLTDDEGIEFAGKALAHFRALKRSNASKLVLPPGARAGLVGPGGQPLIFPSPNPVADSNGKGDQTPSGDTEG